LKFSEIIFKVWDDIISIKHDDIILCYHHLGEVTENKKNIKGKNYLLCSEIKTAKHAIK